MEYFMKSECSAIFWKMFLYYLLLVYLLLNKKQKLDILISSF